MNHSLAQNAYRSNAAPTRTARDFECDVITRITHRMRQSVDRGAAGFPDLVAALDENRRLWEAFDADVRHPGNPLPQDLKARISFLAAFVFRKTGHVLAGEAEARSLIEVNMSVMRGLRATGPRS